MASKRVTLDSLGDEIAKILDEYSGEVIENVDQVTKLIGQKGAAALRNESKAKFPKGTGKYAQGWTSKTEKTRLYTVVTIYNTKAAHLAHLLEFGHVSSNGSDRNYQTDKAPVAGREHVAPVEKALVVEYEKEVKNKI